MPKDIYNRIDKKEKERVDKTTEAFESGKSIDLVEVYGSETIHNFLKERPLMWRRGFYQTDVTLPLNCLIYSKILVSICPGCDCNTNPELIRPYLEKEMILPVLFAPLTEFKADLADLIIQYPYIGVYTYGFLRYIRMMTSDEKGRGLCGECFEKSCTRILKKLSKVPEDRKVIKSLRGYLNYVVFPDLIPTDYQESQILEEIEKAIDKKNVDLLIPLSDKARVLSILRDSQSFGAFPQISQDDLSNINDVLLKMISPLRPEAIEQVTEKEWIVKALNIDYNPAISVEDYLDIILPRKKKINSLVNEFISHEGKMQWLSRVQDEIWKINEEVSSSKALELLTFATSFVSNNAKILFGMLMGGLIGYSSGSFAGCGLGGLGGLFGGIAEKLISKHGAFSIPKYPKSTVEWIKEKLESPEERLLSIMLSKDIRVIQIWSLRKKLKNNQ